MERVNSTYPRDNESLLKCGNHRSEDNAMQFLEIALLFRRQGAKRLSAQRLIVDYLIPSLQDFSGHFVVHFLGPVRTDTNYSTNVIRHGLPARLCSHVDVTDWTWLMKRNVHEQSWSHECSCMQVCNAFGDGILLLSRERDAMRNLATM